MGKTIDCWKDSKTPMKKESNEEKSLEWVGARACLDTKDVKMSRTFTPSDRVLRPRPRTMRSEVMATDAKLITVPASSSTMMITNEAILSRKRNSRTQSGGSSATRKMSSTPQPDLHHRVDEEFIQSQLPLSLDGGLSVEPPKTDYCYLPHQTRDSNSTAISREMEMKINFPKNNDKIWEQINEELEKLIPEVFTKQVINKSTTTELSQKFDTWLHGFFLQRFGPKECKESKGSTRQRRPNKALAHLRKRKKQCKAARKALIKAGLKGSVEEEIICKEWFSLVRQHNKLRIALKKKQEINERLKAEKSFRISPHEFAAKLFNKQQKSGKPAFSADIAQEYFEKTYRDENRSCVYSPLPESTRPQIPKHVFSLRCPTNYELQMSAKKKRNGAAPGMNALTYVPYKKCNAIMKFFTKLARKVWKSKDIPADWSMAYIVLLSKSDNLSVVSEFRPIAIACVAGKIFFSVLSDRLQVFMLKNDYISKEIQKGFLTGLPGCLEHTFALMEALRDAKDCHRQIIIAWLDLANAYGSVRHNLIQFALNWYHVPQTIQAIIFDYYEKLCAKVVTNEWSTGFFLFDIGLFQGCVLSTILFDCVFQLLLDFLQPKQKLGYVFKSTPSVSTFIKAYADDLTLITRNTQDMQKSVDLTNTWLTWTQTMKAKPSKCISIGFKMFDKRIKNEKFTPLSSTIYSPFDPCLVINGQRMRYIVDSSEKDPFKATHFKFLGRWLNPLLNEKDLKQRISSLLLADIDTIRQSKLGGFMKLWLYQFYALPRLSWPFMINDLDKSYALELQRIVNPTLKNWAGVGRTVENGVLFRSKKNFGLGLTAISDHYQHMQLVKCELLRNSNDPTVRELYKTRELINDKLSRVWKATKESAIANAEVDLNLKFPTQHNNQGLGFGNFNPNPAPSERRKLVTSKTAVFHEETRLAHSISLKQQSVWLQWAETTHPFDFSWKNLIWGNVSPAVLKFVLAASVNWVRTPDLMHLWGYKSSEYCCLCGAQKCTLHHILAGCTFALKDKRFTWRHDSILSLINQALIEHVESINQKQPATCPAPLINFVKAGSTTKQSKTSKKQNENHLLCHANDWKLLVDLPDFNYVFPPEIFNTAERPDILLWSSKLKKVLMIELTCPAEEGIEAAKIRKQARYAPLLENIATMTSWKAMILTIEVGARGFVATSTYQVFTQLGFNRQKISALCKRLSITSAKCSYTIFLAANSKEWDKNRPLLDMD
jgi:Reverse transcriptase (RNA-dependent DNA polymerase)